MTYSTSQKASEVEEVFEHVSQNVLHKLRQIAFPKEIVWVLGPTKTGKSELSTYIAQSLSHQRPAYKCQYKGDDFSIWVEKACIELVSLTSREGIVIDDFFAFPDKCVAVLPLIHKFLVTVRAMKQRRNRPLPFPRFRFVFLEADEKTICDRMKNATDDDRARAKREIATYKTILDELHKQYTFETIDTAREFSQVQRSVDAQVKLKDNGNTLRYNVNALSIDTNIQPPGNDRHSGQQNNRHSGHLYRANTWHNSGSNTNRGRKPFWRTPSQNDFGQDNRPMSPYGNSSFYGSMTPGYGSSGYHSQAGTPGRFTFPEDNRNTYNMSSASPRRQPMPTSCRLSAWADSDRSGAFFPSSGRQYSYKPVTHNQTVYTPNEQLPPGTPITSATMRRMSIKSTDSSKIRDVFLQICASLEKNHGKENLQYPREIIWMIGPPGAGKSTLAKFLSEQRSFHTKPIVLREICQSVIAENDGKLKIDQVVAKLMHKLFEKQYRNGVVVDGFVSITCARVVPFMYKYFFEIYDLAQQKLPVPTFKFCVLYVNEDNSVRRQLVNHDSEKKENSKHFDAEQARKLYRKFLKRTQQVVELIEMHFSFSLIDANGTLAQSQFKVSAEIASENNGRLIHDASLTKALSPQTRRPKSTRSYNKTPRSNSFRRTESFKSQPSLSSPKASDFRLQPKTSSPVFQHNLGIDLNKHLNAVDDRDMLNDLRQTVLDITTGPGKIDYRQHNNRLPSAKLCLLDGTNVDEISEDGYVVRPYLKGTHCMVYWDKSGHCYLIDRRFQFFELKSKFYQAAHVGECLLDGVLVPASDQSIMFVAHDAATHRSKRLKECWFSQRSHECKTAISDLNSDAKGEQPIRLVFLETMKLDELNKMADAVEQKDRNIELVGKKISFHGFTFVAEKARFHENEGPKTFTWSFLEEAARDFKIKVPFKASEQVNLYLSGPKNTDACFQRAQLPKENQEKLGGIFKEAEEIGLKEHIIVSCQFSPQLSLWLPTSLQSKKQRASAINAVAENLSSWQNRITFRQLQISLGIVKKTEENTI